MTEETALLVCFELVAERATGPGGPLLEEVSDVVDELAETGLEGVDWGEIFLRRGGYDGDVVGD